MKTSGPDLRERTKAFAVRIVRLVSALPSSMPAQVLGRQVLRSGTSVGANYREAYRGRSKAEFIAKCGDSLRELELLRDECEQLTAILVSIIKRARDSKP